MRLVDELNPKLVFLENVPEIRTRGLDRVLEEFTKRGYDCRWTMLSASETVGAPHKRERWFLLANSNGERCHNGRDTGEKGLLQDNEKWNTSEVYIKGAQCQPKLSEMDSIGTSSDRQSTIPEQACDFTDFTSKHWWEAEPQVDRVVDELPYGVDRIKSLGNSVVPLCVKKAFERLICC